MKCPYCKSNKTRAYDKYDEKHPTTPKIWLGLVRRYGTESITRRYRRCEDCGKQFTTVEVYREEEQ